MTDEEGDTPQIKPAPPRLPEDDPSLYHDRLVRLEDSDLRTEAMLKRAKRWVTAAVTAAAVNLAAFCIYMQNRAETVGAAKEHVITVDRAIEALQRDVAELRALIWQLRKLSDHEPTSDITIAEFTSLQEYRHAPLSCLRHHEPARLLEPIGLIANPSAHVRGVMFDEQPVRSDRPLQALLRWPMQ